MDYKAILEEIPETPETVDKLLLLLSVYHPQIYSLDVPDRSPMHHRLRPRKTTCRLGSDPTSQDDQEGGGLRRMMNLLLSILPLDPREVHAASGVSGASGVILRSAQVLPGVEARGVHFVRHYACKDWLEENRLTVSAQMSRTIVKKGIKMIGISLMVKNFGCF